MNFNFFAKFSRNKKGESFINQKLEYWISKTQFWSLNIAADSLSLDIFKGLTFWDTPIDPELFTIKSDQKQPTKKRNKKMIKNSKAHFSNDGCHRTLPYIKDWVFFCKGIVAKWSLFFLQNSFFFPFCHFSQLRFFFRSL